MYLSGVCVKRPTVNRRQRIMVIWGYSNTLTEFICELS